MAPKARSTCLEVRRTARTASGQKRVKTAETRGIVSAGAHYLDNTANSVGQDSKFRPDFRRERWELRGLLWHETRLPRLASCGRWAITPSGRVQARKTGKAVGYAGLASCGSVHVCPVCNSKIMAVRRIEVGLVLAAFPAAAFGAYTSRHQLGDSLDGLWRNNSLLWRKVAQNRAVKEARADLGHAGIIRAAEVTYGAFGWHPHLHPVHLFDREISQAYVDQLHQVQFQAWRSAAENLGLDAPSSRAQALGLVRDGAEIDRYLTKSTYHGANSVAWEMTSTQTKSSVRAGGLTPWEIGRAVMLGDADALDLWHEWETASKGKRALTYSRGLRAAAGLDAEATDEEIAAAEIGSEIDAGFEIVDWSPFSANPGWGADLLGVIGKKGFSAGIQWCLDRKIEIEDCDPIGARAHTVRD